MLGIALEFLSGGLSKLFSWLKTIPWYVLVIAALCLGLYLANASRDRAQAQTASARAQVVLWRKANSINYNSVQVLLGAVQSNNTTITRFQNEAAESEAAARAYDAKAQQAAYDRDRARAILRSAPPIQHDLPTPDAHKAIEGLL